MDEKKVKEAIEEFKIVILTYKDMLVYAKDMGLETACKMCEEKIQVYETAVEALGKQLPKKPIVVSNIFYNQYQCPRCNDYICKREPICLKCKQAIDWLK